MTSDYLRFLARSEPLRTIWMKNYARGFEAKPSIDAVKEACRHMGLPRDEEAIEWPKDLWRFDPITIDDPFFHPGYDS